MQKHLETGSLEVTIQNTQQIKKMQHWTPIKSVTTKIVHAYYYY